MERGTCKQAISTVANFIRAANIPKLADILDEIATASTEIALLCLFNMKDEPGPIIYKRIVTLTIFTPEEYQTLLLSKTEFMLSIIELTSGVLDHGDGTKTYMLHDICSKLHDTSCIGKKVLQLSKHLPTLVNFERLKCRIDDNGKLPYQYLHSEIAADIREIWTKNI